MWRGAASLAIRLVALLVVAALLLSLAAWSLATVAGVSVGGVARDRAVALAAGQVHSDAPPAAKTAVPTLFGFAGGSPGARAVWSITFSGTFEPQFPGMPPDHTETVFLDYRTGEFLTAAISP